MDAQILPEVPGRCLDPAEEFLTLPTEPRAAGGHAPAAGATGDRPRFATRKTR
jgi:hypothetical protein